jgi:hypothetical protein
VIRPWGGPSLWYPWRFRLSAEHRREQCKLPAEDLKPGWTFSRFVPIVSKLARSIAAYRVPPPPVPAPPIGATVPNLFSSSPPSSTAVENMSS